MTVLERCNSLCGRYVCPRIYVEWDWSCEVGIMVLYFTW